MFSKIKLNISCLLYPSSTLTVNSNLKSSSIGFTPWGVRCFSTSFYLSFLVDSSYYLLSNTFDNRESYIVRYFPSKDDFVGWGYSAVRLRYAILNGKDFIVGNLRNIKYLKIIKTLYNLNLLKYGDNAVFLFQLLRVIGYLEDGHYKITILVCEVGGYNMFTYKWSYNSTYLTGCLYKDDEDDKIFRDNMGGVTGYVHLCTKNLKKGGNTDMNRSVVRLYRKIVNTLRFFKGLRRCVDLERDVIMIITPMKRSDNPEIRLGDIKSGNTSAVGSSAKGIKSVLGRSGGTFRKVFKGGVQKRSYHGYSNWSGLCIRKRGFFVLNSYLFEVNINYIWNRFFTTAPRMYAAAAHKPTLNKGMIVEKTDGLGDSDGRYYDMLDPIMRCNSDKVMANYYHDTLQQFMRNKGLSGKSAQEFIKNLGRPNIYGIASYNFWGESALEGDSKRLEADRDKIMVILNRFISTLNDGSVYRVILVGQVADEGYLMCEKSFYVTRQTSPEFLYRVILLYSRQLELKYIWECFMGWNLASKKWLFADDIMKNFNKVCKIIDRKNMDGLKTLEKGFSVEKGGRDPLEDQLTNSHWRYYDSVKIGAYGVKREVRGDSIVYKKDKIILSVNKGIHSVYGVVYNVIHLIDGVEECSWTDYRYSDKLWVREIKGSGLKLFYNYENNKYSHMCIKYKTSFWVKDYPEYEYDTNIGSLDIETYRIKDGPMTGLCIPYACGYRTHKGARKLFYHSEDVKGINLIIQMIESMLIRTNDKTVFYVHNLARFDGRFILSALGAVDSEYNVLLLGRGINEIFRIKISKKVGARVVSIVLADSVYIVPGKLSDLSISFSSGDKSLVKDVFPHNFVELNNLDYKGCLPSYEFYNGLVSFEEYNQMSVKYKYNNWCLKSECLRYLEKDLDALYNVMDSFNRTIFDAFLVNTTRVSSYSSLSKKVYLTDFYDDKKYKIPVISGRLEDQIRLGYIGGIVDVLKHIVSDAWKYDANSHYPAAMLNEMPIGSPTLTESKDLDSLFGFCYVEVTAPTAEKLRVPVLPKLDDGILTCPRGVFKGMYFSEELKYARELGYKIDVKYSIVFDKGVGLFKDFVEKLYSMKSDAKSRGDKAQELIYKLIVNSLYGKTGQHEYTYSFKFAKKDDLKRLEKSRYIDLIQEFGNKVLVRDRGKIDPELKSLIAGPSDLSSCESNSEAGGGILPPRKKGGVKSSVVIAAAITAYARIAISKYKNIPGNDYIGGDTDSVILSKPLDDNLVGPGLGMMKLEEHICLGLFADKKLYYIEAEGKKRPIIKSRGIGVDEHKNDLLKYDDFLNILAGNIVEVKKTKFIVKQDSVYINTDSPIKVSIPRDIWEEVMKEVNYILEKGDTSSNLYAVAENIKTRIPSYLISDK